MGRINVFVRTLGGAARKFRGIQEAWILPWWGNGVLTATPLWALDTVVLVVKLCSTCVMAVVRIIIPPALKSLHGETILVTGTGHGIGRELAVQFAELGATVICWDNNTCSNNTVVEDIRKKDGECFGFTVDVTDREQVFAAALKVRRQLADVSMVVSNAGVFTGGPLTNLRPEDANHLIEINLMAHVWILQAFLPSMIERRQGHIVAVNSTAGLIPCAESAPYCAAKYGLRGLMESISEELRLDTWTKNINVTSVYLGTVSTGLYPSPCHRFTSLYSEITSKEAAKIIIDGIRKNNKEICIPSLMKCFINIQNLLPYRIRIIFADFFNFNHRGWFCFC